MRGLDGITDSVDMNLSKLWEWWRTEEPGVLQSMRSQRVGHDLATEQQPANERTELGQQDFPGWVCPRAEPRHEVLDASHPFIWLLFPLEEASSTQDPLL